MKNIKMENNGKKKTIHYQLGLKDKFKNKK